MNSISETMKEVIAEAVKKQLEKAVNKTGEFPVFEKGDDVVKSDSSTLKKQFIDCLNCPTRKEHTKAVMICAGKNGSGILAKVTDAISSCNGDVAEISQNILSGFFTLIMIIDIEGLTQKNFTFLDLKNRLLSAAAEMNIQMMVVHEDIINAMQRI